MGHHYINRSRLCLLYTSGREIEGGAGILLDIPLDHSKELKRLTLETLSNDVVIGIMGITLQ